VLRLTFISLTIQLSFIFTFTAPVTFTAEPLKSLIHCGCVCFSFCVKRSTSVGCLLVFLFHTSKDLLLSFVLLSFFSFFHSFYSVVTGVSKLSTTGSFTDSFIDHLSLFVSLFSQFIFTFSCCEYNNCPSNKFLSTWIHSPTRRHHLLLSSPCQCCVIVVS
jgi:hypothetical protein